VTVGQNAKETDESRRDLLFLRRKDSSPEEWSAHFVLSRKIGLGVNVQVNLLSIPVNSFSSGIAKSNGTIQNREMAEYLILAQ
jgi:hypothetical protein